MICPRCGTEAINGRKFCGDCGSPLPWQCSACGSENPPDKRFCGDCGTALAAGAGATKDPRAASVRLVAAERRMLTVMFIDLVGSTALGARLDPEDLREVIAAFQSCVAGLVARYDGFVARYMGDGVLAYFGYPQAHEDDAERAVRAGLGIAGAVAQLNTIAGPPGTLSTRVGVASGLVVVGDLIGFGSSLESAAVGDTPNLAAHLQAVAEPNRVVISDATRRLIGGLFDYQELVSNLKGRPEPEHAWVVLGESLIESRFEALRRSSSPLIGRTEEIELLSASLGASQGRRRTLGLAFGRARFWKVALGRGSGTRGPQYSACASSLFLLTSLPGHAASSRHPADRTRRRLQRGDTAVVKHDKLTRFLLADTSAEDIALFAELLSMPGYSATLPKSLMPQRQKEMTFAAIMRQFEGLARQNPILVILEDMHWTDPTTLDLHGFVRRRGGTSADAVADHVAPRSLADLGRSSPCHGADVEWTRPADGHRPDQTDVRRPGFAARRRRSHHRPRRRRAAFY